MEMKILTFDIEDWFHILDNASTRTAVEWERYPSRVEKNVDTVLEMLKRRGSRATFFCLGYIVERHPALIKRIDRCGFEIASHSDNHQLVYEQSIEEFRRDTDRSVKRIEDLVGKKVRSYRAPGFSVDEHTKWIFDILAEYGIERDCSIFPARRGHGGFPAFRSTKPALIEYNGITIKEFPVSIGSLFGARMVFSGGGYFRLLPYWTIRMMTRNSPYMMTYFHPRDIDAGQPRVAGLSLARRFKTYYGIRSSERKLERFLKDFYFTDLAEADRATDWSTAEVIRL